MDTCVLIPADMSLVLSTGDFWEMKVGVSNTKPLTPGMVFYADEGVVRLDKLEVYKRLKATDIRYKFGCFDDIYEIEDQEVRHCSWTRFLESSTNIDDVNMVGVIVKGRPLFQVIKDIPSNSKMLVYFETVEHTEQHEKEKVIESMKDNNDDDIQQDLRVIESSSPKPDPTKNMSEDNIYSMTQKVDTSLRTSDESGIILERSSLTPDSKDMTTPTQEADDDKSSFSDVASLSEDSHFNVKDDTSGGSEMNSPEILTRTNILSKPPMQAPPMQSTPVIKVPMKRNRERTWLPCDVCGKKFDRPSLLRRHVRTHTGEKPHACDVCGKAFSTSSSLNTHRRIHSGEKPHQCQICGKRFTASSNLYYHRMTHNKEKPHACKLCAKSFPTPGDLKSHMYVHTGTWPFKCDVCNRGFSKQTNLKNHMLLHTGDKPHECRLCGKRFALQCNLKTHLKTHEGESQEECVRCGRMYPPDSRHTSSGYCASCNELPVIRKLHDIPTKTNSSKTNKDGGETAEEPLRASPRFGVNLPNSASKNTSLNGRDRLHGMNGTVMPFPFSPVTTANHGYLSANNAMYPPFYPMGSANFHPGTAGLMHYGPGLTWPSVITQRY